MSILEYLLHHQTEMTNTLTKLVAAESPSHSKADVDHCGGVVLEEFHSLLDGRVETFAQTEVGDQYKLSVGPDTDRQVLIIGHIDTVWDVGAIPLKQVGDFLYGPGVFGNSHGQFGNSHAGFGNSHGPVLQ